MSKLIYNKVMDAIDELILGFQNLKGLENDVRKAANLITDSFKTSGKLLLCGNGGSCADCEHIAGEMVKQFAKERPLSPEIVEKLGKDLSMNCMVVYLHFHFNDWISHSL